MTSNHWERVKDLQSRINNIAKIEMDFEPTEKGMEQEMDWGISKLVSELLFQSTVFSFEKIEKIKTDFEKEHSVEMDLETLFHKGWIRKVLGRYQIPHTIRLCFSYTDKYFNKVEKYQFLLKAVERFYSIEKNIWDDIPKGHLEKFVEDYNNENTILIEYDILLEEKLIFEDKEKVKIGGAQFFPLIVKYLYEFMFIKKLNEKLQHFRKFEEVIIEKKIAEKVINEHRKLFPKTPSKFDILKLEILKPIKENQEYFTFDLRSSKNISCWDLTRDKIIAHLWISLCDNIELNVSQRINIWINKIQLFHFWSIDPKFFPSKYKTRLLDAIVEVITEEKDFLPLDEEIKKIEIDWSHNKNIQVIEHPFFGKSFSKEEYQTFYERFTYFEDAELFNQILIHEEGVRLSLYHLIYIHVHFDNERESDLEKDCYVNFPRIKKVLKTSLDKPVIVWKIIGSIRKRKPEILPYLILEPEFSSIVLKVLFSLEIKEGLKDVDGEGENLISNLWHSSIELFLENLYDLPKSYEENSQRIFEILALIENAKFPHDKTNLLKNKIIRQRIQKTKDRILEFLTPKKGGYSYSKDGAKLIEPKIVKSLFGKIKNFQLIFSYPNEDALKIGIKKLELLIWFHKSMVQFEKAKRRPPVSLKSISKEIIKTYQRIYSLDKVENSWLDTYDFLSLVDWEYIFESSSTINKEDDFLSPSPFKIKKKKDDKSQFRNNRIGWEIRFHLKILLVLFNRLEKKKKELNQDQIELKNKVEQKIIFYIKNYNKDSFEKNSINIFSSFYRMYIHKTDLELFRPVVLFINRLNDNKKRKSIIKNLIESDDVNRLLQLKEQLTSEGDKVFLRKQISEQKIFKFIESGLNFKETQSTLTYLMTDADFLEFAKKVHRYWDEKILSKVIGRHGFHEQEVFAYQVKLVLAYHDRDIERLEKIEPPSNSYRAKEFKDFVKFFKALIKIELMEYESAYKLLNGLVSKTGVYQVLSAQNRFIVSRKIAEQAIKEDLDKAKTICKKMQREWENFRNSIDEPYRNQVDSDDVKFNQLFCFDVLGEFQKFDEVFQDLSIDIQYDSSFANIRVENFVKRNMERQAIEFTEEVRNYHRMYNDEVPKFIKDLKEKATSDEQIKKLRGLYKTINAYNPETQIKIISDDLMSDISIDKFLAKKIINAGHSMLSKINSVHEINNENKYNDIVKVILGASLESENWNISQEQRGGEPASGSKDLGRLDFTIEKQNKVIAIGEALKIDNNPKGHIEKIFYYNPERRLFFILNYFNKPSGFDKAWNNYLKTKVPKVKYPDGYELKKNYPKDLSSDFGINTGSIRIALCELESGTKMYHFYFDLQYLENKKNKEAEEK